MSCRGCRPVLMLVERCLEGAVLGQVVGAAAFLAVPDDVEPRRMPGYAQRGAAVSAGAIVEVGWPRGGLSAVAAKAEVGDRVVELFACGPADSDVVGFPDWRVEAEKTSRAGQPRAGPHGVGFC